MGVESIIEAIGSEASRQIADIRADTERRVEGITDEARAQADEERSRWASSRAEEIGRKRAATVNRARLEAGRQLAHARERLYQQAIRRLRELLAELSNEPRYESVFGALYGEAVTIVADPDATVHVRPEDRGLAERLIAERGGVGPVDATMRCIGGLDVETSDGRAVRNTLDSRLDQSERSLRSIAVATVPEFAGSGSVHDHE